MLSDQDIDRVIGTTALDNDGDEIGSVTEIYLDDQSGRPEWATVKTGMFGTKDTFIPLAQADLDGDRLRFPYDKATVKDAPKVDADGHLSPEEETELYRYYGIGQGTADNRGTTGGRDTTQSTDGTMTRSEEQLHVGTETVEAGRARLRKRVVTENVTTTVPVSHEEVRVVREPITDADARTGGQLSEDEQTVTLHAERAVVDKDTVAVERVRLGTETVTEEQQISETVRKEQIETDGVDTTDTDRR